MHPVLISNYNLTNLFVGVIFIYVIVKSGCGVMAATLALGASAERRGGSSPSIRTI